VRKAWGQRSRTSNGELRKALDALARADAHLKSAPEETHRLTMERLTVALCRWYGGPRT
jgi:DNA polymerase III delta subunit